MKFTRYYTLIPLGRHRAMACYANKLLNKEVYPIVYLDALYVNIKVSGRISKRAVYVALGIDREGEKQLLGLWIGEAEAEGAKFWLRILTELKNRGLKDILITCCDGLMGFPEAIEAFILKPKFSFVLSI